jgi:hypothetical protein
MIDLLSDVRARLAKQAAANGYPSVKISQMETILAGADNWAKFIAMGNADRMGRARQSLIDYALRAAWKQWVVR